MREGEKDGEREKFDSIILLTTGRTNRERERGGGRKRERENQKDLTIPVPQSVPSKGTRIEQLNHVGPFSWGTRQRRPSRQMVERATPN